MAADPLVSSRVTPFLAPLATGKLYLFSLSLSLSLSLLLLVVE